MKFTVNQAANIVGKSRQTIYRHIESKPITVEKNGDGETLIDASELIRIYGDNLDFHQANKSQSQDTPSNSNMLQDETRGLATQNLDDVKELVELRTKVTLLEESSQRERELYEERIESLQRALDKSQDSQNALTKLIENKSGDDNRAGEWEEAFKSLETRLANREKAEQEQADKQRKVLRQNQLLKKALETEKNKSFFQKLFG